jgi:hypothetical protein
MATGPSGGFFSYIPQNWFSSAKRDRTDFRGVPGFINVERHLLYRRSQIAAGYSQTISELTIPEQILLTGAVSLDHYFPQPLF